MVQQLNLLNIRSHLYHEWSAAPPPQLPPWQCPLASTQGEWRRTFPEVCESGSPPGRHRPTLPHQTHLYFLRQRWLQTYTGSSLQSYQCKFGIRNVFDNQVVAAEELGKAIQDVIHHKRLRGKFSSVHPELRREGIFRVEVGENGFQIIRDSGGQFYFKY